MSRDSTDRLLRGQAFHDQVQAAFVAGLVGQHGRAERRWWYDDGSYGQVDLVTVLRRPERMQVVIEIKGTEWNHIKAARVRRHCQSHIRQLQRYLDTAVDDLEAGRFDSVAGALLYPARPRENARLELVEELAADQALMVVWYEDVDWRSGEPSSTPPILELPLPAGASSAVCASEHRRYEGRTYTSIRTRTSSSPAGRLTGIEACG